MSPKIQRPAKKSAALKEMEKLCDEINLLAMMHSRVPKNFGKHFSSLGSPNSIYARLVNGGDVKISLLLALSKHLSENLLDYYIQRLPEEARQTTQTREKDDIIRQLQAEILKLESQLVQYKERHRADQELIKEALRRG